MAPDARSPLVRSLVLQTGFERCGVARAGPVARDDYVRAWLASGRAGSMEYLRRGAEQRLDARRLLEGARSVIVAALSYHQRCPVGPVQPAGPGESARGRTAMYAWGEDYHVVLRDKLTHVVEAMRARIDEPFSARICVDTAPLLEREWAAAAGIGWIAKNTLALHQELGSYFFLGAIVTTLEIEPDAPVEDHCGSCTACLDACPTSAFPAPYEMDATRCISYLTIEHRGTVAAEFHPGMGNWIFGCDVCQEVCPFNRHAPLTREPRFAARSPGPDVAVDEVARWETEDYRRMFTGSAMKRAKLDMWRRNAAIVRQNATQATE